MPQQFATVCVTFDVVEHIQDKFVPLITYLRSMQQHVFIYLLLSLD